MNLKKATYTKNGGKRKSKKWYLDFIYADQRHQFSLYENKQLCKAFVNNLEQLIATRAAGNLPDENLQRWINSLPQRITKNLIEWDLIDSTQGEATRPLKAHLADYHKTLRLRNSKEYAQKVRFRCNKILKDCQFKQFKNIKLNKFKNYLSGLDLSETTVRHYQDAFIGFIEWGIIDGRFNNNPLKNMEKFQRNSEPKGILTPEQFTELIKHTIARNAVIKGVSAENRGLLYILAGITGLRRKELLQLKWADLHLDGENPFVYAGKDNTKNKRTARQPIPKGIAELLSRFRAYRDAEKDQRVFDMGVCPDLAELIRRDLQAAGLPIKDADGNKIYFHSLRNSYITFLANSGTPAKVVQQLARHSDPKLTFNLYARSLKSAEQTAVNCLPNLGGIYFNTSFNINGENQCVRVNAKEQKNVKVSSKTPFLAQKQYPQGESNPCLQNENLVS